MWAKLELIGWSLLIGFFVSLILAVIWLDGWDWWTLAPLFLSEGLFIFLAYLAWRRLPILKWLDFKKVKGLKQ